MGKITDSIKAVSANGKVPEDKAMQIAKQADDLLDRSVELFKTVKGHFGMFIQGEIDMLVGDITKVRSRDQVYYKDREPDGQ